MPTFVQFVLNAFVCYHEKCKFGCRIFTDKMHLFNTGCLVLYSVISSCTQCTIVHTVLVQVR